MAISELELIVEGRSRASSGRGKELRELAGLKQTELARLVGCSAAAINRWEAGLRTPGGDLAVAYAKALRRVEEMIERAAA